MVRHALTLLAALSLPAAAQAAPPKPAAKAAPKAVAKPLPKTVDAKEVEAAAHDAYVAAINSNDIAAFSAALTDDVVYQYPGARELVGKKAVLAWATGYYQLYSTHWEKTSIGFTVSGDWAFERYTYKSTDTEKATGKVTTDAGKGVNVFHHDKDGKWRVAIDGWSSDDGVK